MRSYWFVSTQTIIPHFALKPWTTLRYPPVGTQKPIARVNVPGCTAQLSAIMTSSTSSCAFVVVEWCRAWVREPTPTSEDDPHRPQWPWACGRQPNRQLVQFFPTNERLSLFLASIMGLQHSLVMMVGLVFAPVSVAALALPGTTVPQCTHCITRFLCCALYTCTNRFGQRQPHRERHRHAHPSVWHTNLAKEGHSAWSWHLVSTGNHRRLYQHHTTAHCSTDEGTHWGASPSVSAHTSETNRPSTSVACYNAKKWR